MRCDNLKMKSRDRMSIAAFHFQITELANFQILSFLEEGHLVHQVHLDVTRWDDLGVTHPGDK